MFISKKSLESSAVAHYHKTKMLSPTLFLYVGIYGKYLSLSHFTRLSRILKEP